MLPRRQVVNKVVGGLNESYFILRSRVLRLENRAMDHAERYREVDVIFTYEQRSRITADPSGRQLVPIYN